MSELKTDKISPRGGTDVTLGDASDTFTIPASATLTVAGTLNVTGSVTATDKIDSAHYAAGSIDNEHLAANSVDSDQYVDGSIDNAHLAANSVDSDQYVDGSIDNAHLAANSVDSDQYVDGSIDNAHLADDAVNSDELAAGSVDIAHLSATGTAGSGNFLRGDNSWTAVVVSDGPSLVLLDTQTASNSATLDFTTAIDDTYSNYVFLFSRIVPATDNANFMFRVSEDGGSTYKSGATDYEMVHGILRSSNNGWTTSGLGASVGLDAGYVAGDQGNVSTEAGSGHLNMYSPASAIFHMFDAELTYMTSFAPASAQMDKIVCTYNGTSNVIDAIQFFYSSGNITSGIIRLYGRVES